jgi:GT2 family glycosyltransferase
MLSYLDEHPRVGALGSGLINEDGSHTDSMFRFPSVWSEIESAVAFGPVSKLLRGHRQSLGALDKPAPVDWVAGTSFIARAQALRAVGGFDEDFFLYWEEVELCHRIKQAGWEIHGLPDAKVRHLGGVSTGMHNNDRRIPGYWHQSRNLYFRKTGTGGNLSLLNLATALSLLVSRALELAKGAPARHPQFLRDHIRHALDLRSHRGEGCS